MFIGPAPDMARGKETVQQGIGELEMHPVDQEHKLKTESMQEGHNGHAFI
jgi:hypothetical protein